MPEAGTQTSLAHAGSGGPDWRGMGPADPETGQRLSNGFRIPVAAPAFQAMDTQLNALPTLPVLARTVSGCLNSAFRGLF